MLTKTGAKRLYFGLAKLRGSIGSPDSMTYVAQFGNGRST